jgi:putative hydrolase of the HAD superfamily
LKNVIFDLGGVVLEWSPERILEGYYTADDDRAAMKTALFQHDDWLHLDRGTLSEPQLVSNLQARTGRPAGELQGLLDAVRASLHAKPDTVALLNKLVARGVPLFCLSNISARNFDYLRERHEFWGVFRGIVISADLKLMKPEPEIFAYLLHRYGLSPAETVFVDDNPPNVRAAQALGMQGILFRNARQCAAELEAVGV